MTSKRELLNRTRIIDKRFLIRQWFYVVILALVWIQILLFPTGPDYLFSSILLGIGASIYTSFKMIQPLRWHESIVINVILFSLDVSVCSILVILSGGIHSPFILYSLAPVVTAAILLERIYTFVIVMVTFGYVLASFFIHSTTGVPDSMAEFNDFVIYLLALFLASILPYLMNVKNRQLFTVKAILFERQQLAREIHDSLCQTIYGIRWQIQMQRNGMSRSDQSLADKKIDSLLEEAETDARNLISSLRSHKLGGSFVDELKTYLNKCETEYGISYELKEYGLNQDLDELVQSEAMHICEEALRNAIKHSKCNNIVVQLFNSNSQLKVTIADNGCGFNKTSQMDGRGLTVMKERAESVGGHLDVMSSPGISTKIQLEVPRKCPLEVLLSTQ